MLSQGLAFNLSAIMGAAVPLAVFAIPIVAILTAHQRKMAELVHSRQDQHQGQVEPLIQEVKVLRHELAEMRQQLNRQEIALDDLKSGGSSSDVSERLSQDA